MQKFNSRMYDDHTVINIKTKEQLKQLSDYLKSKRFRDFPRESLFDSTSYDGKLCYEVSTNSFQTMDILLDKGYYILSFEECLDNGSDFSGVIPTEEFVNKKLRENPKVYCKDCKYLRDRSRFLRGFEVPKDNRLYCGARSKYNHHSISINNNDNGECKFYEKKEEK